MKYLIVSADDLGLSESLNKGIIRGYEEGIVTSLHVIPSGAAFYDALNLLKTVKPGEVSAHLALTETSPVTPAADIPTLVDSEGNFRAHYPAFFAALLSGRIDKDEIYRELKNQLERVMSAGIPVKALSSHEHIHMAPRVLDIFIRLAKEYKIPSIRCLTNERLFSSAGIKKACKMVITGALGGRMKRSIENAGLLHADNVLGFLDSGNIREDLLLKMIRALPEGTTELVAHPGLISSDVLDRCIFHSNCETDLAALTSRSVKKAIADNGIKLISFGELK